MRSVLCLSLVLLGLVPAFGAPVPKKESEKLRVSEQAIAAYEKLGATTGRCLPLNENLMPKNILEIDSTVFVPGVPEDDTLLVFRFEKAPKLTKDDSFTNPKAPFGIDFGTHPLTDDECKELAAAESLEVLKFDPSKLTAKGYKELAKFKNLKKIHLTGMGEKTEALKQIAEFKNPPLEFSVGGRVEDEGIAELAKIKGLERLDLFPNLAAPLTDGSVPHFGQMKKLKQLRIIGFFRMTEAGEKKMKESLPKDCQAEVAGARVQGID